MTGNVDLGAVGCTGAVFIDAGVPYAAALAAGVDVGQHAFLLDPGRDGLTQIADRLAMAGLSGLASVTVVAHGAPGRLALGQSSVGEADLSGRAGALAAIGAALAPGGGIALYACRAAARPEGRSFLAALSRHAGGAPVAAATAEVGATAAGRNWTLDAASAGGRKSPASPFTAATMRDYAGTLPTGTDGQLIINTPYDGSNEGEQYLNSDSTTETGFAASGPTQGTAIDPVLGIIFETEPEKPITQPDTIDVGRLAVGAAAPTPNVTYTNYFTANFQADSDSGDTAPGYGLAIDTVNHVLYQTINSTKTSENGILQIPYSVDSSGNVNFGAISFLEKSAGNVAPSYGQYPVYYNGYLYYLDYDYARLGTTNPSEESGVYRVATAAGANHTPQLIAGPGQYGGTSAAIQYTAIDRTDNRLYFTSFTDTSSAGPQNETIEVLSNASTATQGSGLAPLTCVSGVAVPTFRDISSIAYDDASSVLYVSDLGSDANDNAPYANARLYRLQLNASGTVTSVTTINDYDAADPGDAPVNTLTFTSLPTLALASGTSPQATQGGSAVRLQGSAPAITDVDGGGYVSGATVSIVSDSTGTYAAGDVLGVIDSSGTFHTFTATATSATIDGQTFAFSFANGVLTIANVPASSSNNGTPTANEHTAADYQTILSKVAYRDGSTTAGSRTATYQVNNGAIGSPSGSDNAASTAVQVYVPPPVVTAGGGTAPTYTEQGTAATVDGAISVSDPAGNMVDGATVTISGGTYQAGDTLAFTAANGVAGTYSTATGTGVLTLSGAASASAYQQALQSVTFSSTSQNPDHYGSDKTRSIAFQVTDPDASSNTATDTVDVAAVNNPPMLSGIDVKTFTQGANGAAGAAVKVDDGIAVADPDNQTLQSATVVITNVVSGDVLAFTNNSAPAYGNISATYDNAGTLTLTSAGATATLAQFQAALDAVTFTTASQNPTDYGANTSRTVTVQANDGSNSDDVSNNLTTSVNIAATDQSPVVTASGSTVTFHAAGTGSTPVVVEGGVTVSDPGNQTLASATVKITNVQTDDVLGFTPNANTGTIAISSNGAGTLVLTASSGTTATVSQFQAALDAVTFSNPDASPSTTARTVTFSVDDGTDSATAAKSDSVTVQASPVITGEAFSSASGSDIKAGSTVSFTVTFSAPVTVTDGNGGAPYLTLNTPQTETAILQSGSGSATLTFSHTVQPGDDVSDLKATSFVVPAGTTIQNGGSPADTSGFGTIDTGVRIDTVAPSITAVADGGPGIDANGNGDLNAGNAVTLTVTTSEPVYVQGGQPTLTLNDGGTATYTGGSGTAQQTFSYTVGAGQNTAKLAVTAVNANGATVTDGAGNPLNPGLMSAAVPSGTLVIDTTPPVASSPTDIVAQNSGPTPIGIGAPSDNLTATGSLAIAAGTLPTDGTVTLADGTTPVVSGQALTAAQLTGLQFTPTPGVSGQGSTFTYTVTDGAGNATQGTSARRARPPSRARMLRQTGAKPRSHPSPA